MCVQSLNMLLFCFKSYLQKVYGYVMSNILYVNMRDIFAYNLSYDMIRIIFFRILMYSLLIYYLYVKYKNHLTKLFYEIYNEPIFFIEIVFSTALYEI